LQALSPELLLILSACVLYLAGAFWGACRCWAWIAVGVVALAAVTLGTCAATAKTEPAVAVVVNDAMSTFVKGLSLLGGLLLVLVNWNASHQEHAAEYFASLLLVVAGMMLVGSANELVLLFVGLELVSIPSYLLLYLPRRDALAQEAAAKYFFLGIFSAALLLYGLALLYGATGTTNLGGVHSAVVQVSRFLAARPGAPLPAPDLLLVAAVLVLAGFGFKVAAVPFHFYAPDVYQGTTNALAALLAWAPKAAGFFGLLRVLVFAMPGLEEKAAWAAWVIAAATMTLGNLLGLLQDNLRRLLAYSSIAHAGYMMVGLGVGCLKDPGSIGTSASGNVLFYLATYATMTLGVFAVVIYLSSDQHPVETVDDLAGLSRTHPLLALVLAACLLSLTGIPLTAGFWGKLTVFSSAIASGHPRYLWLAVIGVLNAAIASYYYLRIIGVVYLREPYGAFAPGGGRPAWAAALLCGALTLAIGLFPRPLLHLAQQAAEPLSYGVAAGDQPEARIQQVLAGAQP
jgi:NADH-quinone oxidoreductase subunit N